MPQTIPGKIIGMVWGLIGICLISCFTAAITTIMVELMSGSPPEPIITDQIIGVIKGSIERHLVLQQGGTPLGINFPLKQFTKSNFQIVFFHFNVKITTKS